MQGVLRASLLIILVLAAFSRLSPSKLRVKEEE